MPEGERWRSCRDAAIDAMMEDDPRRSRRAERQHEVFFSERSLHAGPGDKVRAAIETLRAGPHLRGRAAAAEGGRRTTTGRTASRRCSAPPPSATTSTVPLMKSDGSYTYFASDIAYHKDKAERGFLEQIDVWGADHGGYVKRMQAAA
jgi:arginyl-tRNA synthetase